MNELLGGCFESSATSGVTRELLARGKIIPRYCTCDLSLRTPLSSYHYHNLNETITVRNLAELLKIIITYLFGFCKCVCILFFKDERVDTIVSVQSNWLEKCCSVSNVAKKRLTVRLGPNC